MSKRNIAGGLALILLAVYWVVNGLGLIPDVPWFRIICSFFLVWAGLRGLIKRDFFSGVMSLCLVAWLWESYIPMETVREMIPWPLLGAGALLGIGLNMIFKREKTIHVQYQSDDGEWKEGTIDDVKTTEWTDGRHVKLENNFGSVSKYVKADAFSTADIENNFGSTNVYFNNAVIANGEAKISIENNFGETNVYFPRNWRVRVTEHQAFGSIKTFGAPNNDMDAPLAIVDAECNFGMVRIYFE